MDMNKIVNEMNLKKVFIAIAGVFIVVWIIGAIFFTLFMHTIWKQYHTVEKEVNQGIEDSRSYADKFEKSMDEQTNKLDSFVDNHLKQSEEMMKKGDEAIEKGNAELMKDFENVRKDMLAQHEKFGREMRKKFNEDTKAMDRDFMKRAFNDTNKDIR